MPRCIHVEICANAVRLYRAEPDRRLLAAALRRPGALIVFTRSIGLTLHRNAGLSIVGVPSIGGTSILWGTAKERVDRLGSDHRALRFGPVGVYIGRDY